MKNIGIMVLGGLFVVGCAPANTGLGNAVVLSPVGQLRSGVPSGVSGKATLGLLTDGLTRVVVSLSGMEPNSRHAMHIHEGSCANPGGVAIGLPDVTADGTGAGGVDKTVDTAKIPKNAYIFVHQNGSDVGAGAGISCGDLKPAN